MTPRATDFEPTEQKPSPKKRTKPKKRAKRPKKIKLTGALKQINLNAAGIDIGSAEHYVAVPEDRDGQTVRSFNSFTIDLEAIADWLDACDIETVAMESTGVYWIPLLELLEVRGFEVVLVDPHKLKNVSGRKTDVLDCQWIQQLHTYGLLSGAFRPSEEITALRSLTRQRAMLISRGSDHTRHMQKALDQMNLKLKQVISSLTGATGLRIIQAILGGERDPRKLAALRDPGCRNDEETIAMALEGNWRDEHIFALCQAHELYQIHQKMIGDCDLEIEAKLATLPDALGDLIPFVPKKRKSKPSHPLAFDAYGELHRVIGVDLTEIPGLDAPSVLALVSEIGFDMTRWATVGAFSSWLGLCPGNRVTGGKRLSSRTKTCANRAAAILRLAAYGLQHAKTTYLAAFYRRMKARMGPAKAITATAHKLARIIYSMLLNKTPYIDQGVNFYEEEYQQRRLDNLKHNARSLGFMMVPIPNDQEILAEGEEIGRIAA